MSYAYGIYSPNKRMKMALLVFLIVTIGTIFMLMMDIEQNSPQFCSSCHTMRPELYTWEASTHSNVGCIECHRDPGVGGQVQMLVDLARMAESTVFKSYVTPIRKFRSIDDERCFQCHSYNRQASASGDLIIPHEDHTSSKVRCASCHSGVAHGDIAKRKITAKVDYKQWDTDKGLQEMARELSQPSMDTCMSCHYRRKITTDCAACHTDMFGPDNHRFDDFDVAHGQFAREELQDCNFCHGYVGAKKMAVKEDADIVEYSRNNAFCLSCHRTEPDSHQTRAFSEGHGRLITSGGKEKSSCLVCHDNNVQDLPQATNTSCATCHPSSHGKNWRGRHSPALEPGVKLNGSCFSCHSETTCLSCHYLPEYSEWLWGPKPETPATDFDPFELGNDFFL